MGEFCRGFNTIHKPFLVFFLKKIYQFGEMFELKTNKWTKLI